MQGERVIAGTGGRELAERGVAAQGEQLLAVAGQEGFRFLPGGCASPCQEQSGEGVPGGHSAVIAGFTARPAVRRGEEDLLEFGGDRRQLGLTCGDLAEAAREVTPLEGGGVIGAVGQRGGGLARVAGEQGCGGELEVRFGVVIGLPAVQPGERQAGTGWGRRVGEHLPLPGRVGQEVVGGVESCCDGVGEQSAVQPERGVGRIVIAEVVEDGQGGGVEEFAAVGGGEGAGCRPRSVSPATVPGSGSGAW